MNDDLIKVPVPPEMVAYRNDLEYFFQTMIRKLYTNRHKGFDRQFDMAGLLKALKSEVAEVEKALAEEGQFDVAVEAADVANIGFLIALMSWHMTREQFDKNRAVPPEVQPRTYVEVVGPGPQDVSRMWLCSACGQSISGEHDICPTCVARERTKRKGLVNPGKMACPLCGSVYANGECACPVPAPTNE